MKKLLISLILAGLTTHFLDSVKTQRENHIAAFLNSDFFPCLKNVGSWRANYLLREFEKNVYKDTLFPGVDRLFYGSSQPKSLNQMYHDANALAELTTFFQENKYPEVRPFLKLGYATFRLRYNRNPSIYSVVDGNRIEAPSAKELDSYPASFEKGSDTDIILGPLLHPGKITQAQYQKSRHAVEQSFHSQLKFLLRNRSDILFPGSEEILTLSKINSVLSDLGFYSLNDIKHASNKQEFSKPNKKRDLTILKNFWKESINDPALLPLIKKGYENFRKAYRCNAPVRSILVEKDITLGSYADQHPKSPVAALCNTLEPARSNVLRNTLIFGALSGIAYVVYKKYSTQQAAQSNLTTVL